MLDLLTIEDILEWNCHYKNSHKSFMSAYNIGEEEKMYGSFHYLVNYYFFKENCNNALKKLKPITVAENFLETDNIKQWVLFHEWLGAKKLASFLKEYAIDVEHSTLEIAGLKIFVELKPLIPLVVFCEVFQILHRELQLHLPDNERAFETYVHYYYTYRGELLPGRRVKNWLAKVS